MKKWLIATGVALIVLPTLVFGRDRILKVWAAPATIEKVDKKVDDLTILVKEQGQTQKQIADLIIKQDHRIDKNEAVTTIQIAALEKIVDKLEKRK